MVVAQLKLCTRHADGSRVSLPGPPKRGVKESDTTNPVTIRKVFLDSAADLPLFIIFKGQPPPPQGKGDPGVAPDCSQRSGPANKRI